MNTIRIFARGAAVAALAALSLAGAVQHAQAGPTGGDSGRADRWQIDGQTVTLNAGEGRELAAELTTHYGDARPRFMTTPCQFEDSVNCYWDAGEVGNGRGWSFYAIPIGRHRVAVVYWDHPHANYVTAR